MIYLSVCSRKDNRPKALDDLVGWHDAQSELKHLVKYSINYDFNSIYEGHSNSLEGLKDEDVIVMCHDDVEIISTPDKVYEILNDVLSKPKVGFVGVAGCSTLPKNAVWWEARKTGEARGFVFQGDDPLTMVPNYFGPHGEVVALDGCFLAVKVKTLKDIGLVQPKYLSSKWDFYDIHMTFTAYLKGYSNYTVPIIIRHESPGNMREGWYDSQREFLKEHGRYLPCRLPMDKTHGLPN